MGDNRKREHWVVRDCLNFFNPNLRGADHMHARRFCHLAHSKGELHPNLQETLPEPTVASLYEALGLEMGLGRRPLLLRPRGSDKPRVPCKCAVLLGPGKCRRDRYADAHHPKEIDQTHRVENLM
uniref:Uncharacterized protein n=1 Tax=Chromera velia CCMP2878 TaxID=1169474 RepID=A0A0G4FCL7_9ALVE|eukprot:Cvel_3209.t1-p1 / transcript=Cvel_3209.t1 / gene=Cvel_3209 / organism=Chromera_velia_CCMP2878 / gene_product=hypothetical protein / transcript_product=hypothetical protein / location=Cvel_scaffold125:71747-72493(-) / protein_length=124 / sequence_SO=supercontig / SO=protein_coding / is_pseudo=false